jgi:hypothetical protein
MDYPELLYQMWWDMELVGEDARKSGQERSWKRRGESASAARDRLRAERLLARSRALK